MKQRVNLIEKGNQVMKPLFGVKKHLDQSSVDNQLIELLSLRVSQINGCAACLEMHSKALLAKGESTQRLILLDAWRETPFYSEKERAALEWAEAVTTLEGRQVSDDVYEKVAQHFTEAELIDLTIAVTFINTANRLNIAFRTPVGTYDAHQVLQSLEQAQ
jgi:AhpD family alkylhydroperoxidase